MCARRTHLSFPIFHPPSPPLGKRFGRRKRPYVQHLAKSVSHSLLQEIALVWPAEVAATGAHSFRETEAGEGDFYQLFVFNHFLVERAREALLWTWAVGRVGGLDDAWGAHEEARAWIELGGGDDSREIAVESGLRETLRKERVRENLEESGIRGNIVTDYHFCAQRFSYPLLCAPQF